MPENFISMRQKLLMRWGQLKTERASWWGHWQEISTYLLPWNGRYFRQDRDKGVRRNNQIYDNTGTRALRTLGAGLMAGVTSPARPWFRLGTHDPALNNAQPVKLWLADVAQRMHAVFLKSNTYDALQQMYEELGAFGTAASIVLPDFNTVIHHYPLTIGEYAIGVDWQGRVTTLYREFEKTVSEMVKEFGIENCSTTVQSLYHTGQLGAWIPIVHAIEPRTDRDPSKRDARNMEWGSWYFELSGESQMCLRESGFKQFPVMVPRWALAGGDIYGNSPGMESLGDIKALQHEQLRKAQAIDYQTMPPLQVPDSLKNKDLERLPGGVTFVPTGGSVKIETAFDVELNLAELLEDIQDVRERIQKSFFYDIFLMIANSPDPQKTAAEIAARHEEKMMMLGPVLQRVNNELLLPLIHSTFAHMAEMGALPPAPPELAGLDLNVEFISVLAQAQKASETFGVDRFVGSLGTVAQLKPDVLDKFDSDAWADRYSDMLGVDPSLILANDQVAMLRQSRAQAQAAQQKMAAAAQASAATKNFAQAGAAAAQPGAQDVMNQFSGYTGG
ncbi:MAG TPA: portal protein [Terracidiphilus sp.]|nr:portal protein [Terracidiphilus sp.]